MILKIADRAGTAVMEGHYHHDLLKPGRVAELIHRARNRAIELHGRHLLVSASEAALLSERQWTAEQIDEVMSACDVLIVHGGDDVETGKVGDASDLVRKVEALHARPWYQARPRPILTNEAHGEACFEALLRRGVSFGLHSTTFQTMYPPRWGVWENDTSWFFERVRELTL